jgi:hypothetical protein
MPFSGTSSTHTEAYWTSHFEHILKPLIEEIPDLQTRRSQPLRGDILRQIIADLIVSSVVVADLTDHNPNVLWELGVRQSFRHGTITIAEQGTRLPFDLSAKSTLFYNRSDTVEWEEFRRRLKYALQDCLTYPEKSDSPVLESVTGRGTLFEIFNHDATIRRIDALLSEVRRNEEVFEEVYETANENLQKSGRSFVTNRFRSTATEFLLTNRYIEETSEFYEAAEEYYDAVIAYNYQLNEWTHDADTTEKWFVHEAEGGEDNSGRNVLREFKKRVEKSRKELMKRV